MGRVSKSTEYVRHDFTPAELLAMGGDLADAYNALDQIDNEEAVIKAKIKERKADVQQRIGTLSRNISARFDMQNIEVKWVYDSPNVGEVSYLRADTNEIVKTRPMSLQERQQELPLEPVAVNPQKPEETQAAVEGFFVSPEVVLDPDKFPEGDIVDAEFVDPEVDVPAELEPPAEPEASRQRLLTMKGRKKKPVDDGMVDMQGKAPSGEDFDF